MPLIKSKSKQAFKKNLETEMKSGKPQDRSLAIAYAIKRKAKKMAEGGGIHSKRSAHARLKGVNTSGGFSGLEEKGQSQAGRNIERAKEPQPNKYLNDLYHGRGVEMHREKLKELREMPNPKLKGLAEGGRVTPKSRADIHQGSTFKVRDTDMLAKGGKVGRDEHETGGVHAALDEESGISRMGQHVRAAKYDTSDFQKIQAQRSAKRALTEANKIRPKLKGLAEGGAVPPGGIDKVVPDTGFGKIIIMKRHAEGGEVDSIVDEIMSRRQSTPELESDSDIDEQMMLADGGPVHPGDEMLKEGEVDIDDNAREIPNQFYHLNEDEALEHNFDEDMMDMEQPMDSNETGDPREDEESDSHDMVDAIRRRMKSKSK